MGWQRERVELRWEDWAGKGESMTWMGNSGLYSKEKWGLDGKEWASKEIVELGLARVGVGLGWDTVPCTVKEEWGLDGKEWFGKEECRRVRDGAVWWGLRSRCLVNESEGMGLRRRCLVKERVGGS